MEAVFVLIFISIALMFISLYKKDFSLITFSGISFFISGLLLMNSEITTMPKNYAIWFGFFIMFLGLYLIVRTGIEMLTKKKEDQ